ncbi:MAG: hypothetical protein M1820_004237 [Bogoriella megaspora]|nr:MAG: hypothetical protein M1820_004237 [Bogoriella megaspora]
MTWIYNASPELEAQSRYKLLIAVTLVFMVFSTAAVVTRLFLRRKDIRADDITIILALLFNFAYGALTIYDTRWGSGLSPQLRPKQDAPVLAKLAYANRVYYGFFYVLWKVAACITYLRLMEGSQRIRMKQAIYAVLAFSIALHLTYGFGNLLFCIPIEKNWVPTHPGKCINFARWNYTIASLTIFNDVLIWSLPLPMFLPLRMDRRTKIGLLAIFLFGFVTSISSIARAVAIRVIVRTSDNFDTVLWQTIEYNLALISICLPFLRPVWQSRKRGQQYGSWEMKNSNSGSRSAKGSRFGTNSSVLNSRTPGPGFQRTGSDEMILGKGETYPSGGITRVFEFDVQRTPA